MHRQRLSFVLTCASLALMFGCARLEFQDEKDGPNIPPPPVDVCEEAEATPYCPPYGTQCYDNSVYACDDKCGHPVGVPQRRCADDERCESDGTDAFCRPCLEGECDPDTPEPTECDPGVPQPFCASWNTTQRCQSDGTFSAETTCATNTRCNRGLCNSGEDSGARCQNDTQCRGALCLCGQGYTSAASGECALGMAYGYCSTRSCLTDGCPDTQLCADFRGTTQANGLSLCLPTNSCTTRGDSCTIGNRTLRCSEVPTRPEGADGPRHWELTCFTTNVAEIGAECVNASSCIGRECDLKTVGGQPSRYCSATCSSEDECPSYSVCVELPGKPQRMCARLASECTTRLESDPSLEIKNLTDSTGAPVAVCHYR